MEMPLRKVEKAAGGEGSTEGKSVWVKMGDVFFFKGFIYIFLREGKGGRKRGRETSMYGCLLRAPTGDMACNPGMCPRQEIEPATLWFSGQHSTLSHTSQGGRCFQFGELLGKTGIPI